MRDPDRFDDWPVYRPRRIGPRIDRRHDPVYASIRAELEAREQASRRSGRPELVPAIAVTEGEPVEP